MKRHLPHALLHWHPLTRTANKHTKQTPTKMPVFTASDGTKFEDRNAWRRYEFETNYTFRNKKSETLEKLPGKISGQPFDLSDLDGCEVRLLDQCDQVQIDNLTNCRVFIGPCSESVFVRNCSNCVFTVACKQLRTRDCTDCTFALYSLTDPIIETSNGMVFTPFNGAYHGIEQHFRDARLEPDNNHWSLVYDFNDPDKSGHNWRLQKAGEPWVLDLTDKVPDASALGPCTNPVPQDAGYIQYADSSSSSTAGGMQSFSFQTSQQEAEKAVAAAQPAVATAAPCEAQEPALAMPLAPPPPAPVQALDSQPPSLPPPAPVQSTVTENQKVTVVEAAELLDPPPCAGAGCCSSKSSTEPAIESAIEKATDKLQELSLGLPTPPATM